jgi:CRP-like cAMP-binding protein
VAVVEKALRDCTLKHVAHMPPPDCVLADYEGGVMNFEVRYWLQDQLHDAAADSNVLMHVYSALRRNEFILARPLLDMRLAQQTTPKEVEPDDDEIERRSAILAHVMLFFNLTDDERRKVATRLRVTPFMKDDVITRQGSVAHWLYVLVEGEADVWYETRNGQRRLVTSLGAGAVFGEMGLMTGAPRAATVAARCDSICFRIDKESFEDILRARPALADEIARIISERHTELDAVRGEDHAEVADRDANSLLGKIRRFFHLELYNSVGK